MLVIAAAVMMQPALIPFGGPVDDSALAATHALTPPSSAAPPVDRFNAGMPVLTTGEQVDVWWSEQGALMIAEAVRPTPEFPQWLEGWSPGAEPFSLHFQFSRSDMLRSTT